MSAYEETRNENSEFLINKDLFDKELRDGFVGRFNPTKCLLFSIPLPFQLPFKDGTLFSTVSKELATAFTFSKYTVEIPMPYTLGSGHTRTFMRTRAEMAAFIGSGSRVEDIGAISELTAEKYQFVYEHCNHLINRLNDIIYGFRMLVEDSKTHSVHLEQFFLVHMSVISLPNWLELDNGSFIVCANPSNYEDITLNLPQGMTNAVGHLGMNINFNPGLFSTSVKFYANARRHLHRGEYSETLISLGLCSESYLNGIYRCILEENGMDESQISDKFEATPFMSRIKKTLCQAVGGRWDLDDEGCPPGKWNKHVYVVRGRVVHGGYLPSIKEAWVAFMTMSEFDGFLRGQIEKNQSKLGRAYEELCTLPELFIHGNESAVEFDIS